MVGHDDDDTSSRMMGQVFTTPGWYQERVLAIEMFTRGELDSDSHMPHELRPRRNLAIGKRLELARIAFGMANAQGKFAEAAGIRPNTYSMWEIGENFPGLDNTIKLCQRHAGLSLDWIYLGKVEGMPLWLANAISALIRAEEEREPQEPAPTPAPVPLPRTAKVVKATRRAQRQRA